MSGKCFVLCLCLVVVGKGVATLNGCQLCTCGFPNMTTISLGPAQPAQLQVRQWLFPNITLSCNGNITKWTFRATSAVTLSTNAVQFQIWRLVSPPGSYRLVLTTGNAVASNNVQPPLYVYDIATPMPVEAGDVLGILVPSAASLLPIMASADNNASYYYQFNPTLPLITLPVTSLVLTAMTLTLSPQVPLVTVEIATERPQSTTARTTSTFQLPLSTASIPTTSTTLTTSTTMPVSQSSLTFVTTTQASAFSQTSITTTTTPSTISTPTVATPPAATPPATPPAPPLDSLSSNAMLIETMPTSVLPTSSVSLLPSSLQIPIPQSKGVEKVGVVIGIIVAVVFLVMVAMGIILVVLLIRRRSNKYTLATTTDASINKNPNNVFTHNRPSLDNPIYQGGLSSDPTPRCSTYAIPDDTAQDHAHGHTHGDTVGLDFYSEVNYQQVTSQFPVLSKPPTYEKCSEPIVPSQYEVPVSTLEAKVTSGCHQYAVVDTVEGGIYVPTEEERRTLSGSATLLNCDVSIYSRWSMINHFKQPTFFEEEKVYWRPAMKEASLYDQLRQRKYREILRHQICVTEHIGSGEFGTVNRGVWQSPLGTLDVAVKMLRPGASDNDRVKFLQEAAIMGQFLHPNIIRLQGVVTVGLPLMIIIEYMAKGDLRKYLKNLRSKQVSERNLSQLLMFCRQIASGMCYLANKGFVHRDLAARNILVSEDDQCKVGDFGMSRNLEYSDYYITHGGKIPVKWTAPEALHYKKYSVASDVWSFGCVLYEIWSLGRKPFEACSNQQAADFISEGVRLAPPPGTSRVLYSLMIRCWHEDSSLRPSFAAIVDELSAPDASLLQWEAGDLLVGPHVAVLGAPLSTSERLYPDLQKYYLDKVDVS